MFPSTGIGATGRGAVPSLALFDHPQPDGRSVPPARNAQGNGLGRGAAAWAFYSAYLFVTSDMYWLRKSLIGSIPLGFLLLLLSAARQRMLEWPHDRYRRVRK